MIRRCDDSDFETILAIVNDGARAYRGIIPPDRWSEPYTSSEHLRHVQRDMGLRLEPRKEPISILVIDQVNKVPTAN
jgi:uncharacterized protein (TIGR03435 family)